MFPGDTCVILIRMLAPESERARDRAIHLRHQKNIENLWALSISEETTKIVTLACEIGAMGKAKTFKD